MWIQPIKVNKSLTSMRIQPAANFDFGSRDVTNYQLRQHPKFPLLCLSALPPPGPIEKLEHPRKTPVAASPEASTPFLIFLCGSAEQMHF